MKPNKKKLKLYLVVTAVFLFLIVLVPSCFKNDKNQETSFREEQIARSDIEITILSTGIVQPENRLEIKPPIAGRVETVFVKEGQKVKKGQVLGLMSSSERAALLDAARAKGEEELKNWEELYKPIPIMAPINGMIILRNVEPGQTFTNTDFVFVMSDRLSVEAQVDETDIAQIKTGQKTKIVLDAYPQESIPARVEHIAYEAKTVNNVTTYIVSVIPEKTPEHMRSGMTANVTFIVNSKSGVLTVSNDALTTIDGKNFIQVRDSKGNGQENREIILGLNDNKKSEVLKGVTEGDIYYVPEVQLSETNSKEKNKNPFMPSFPKRGTKRTKN